MKYLVKPATSQDIDLSVKSVKKLDSMLSDRFLDLSEIQIIAWASDLHIHDEDHKYPEGYGKQYEHIYCTRQLILCLHEINALTKKPDLIVLGGDITDMGLEGEWKEFARIMNLGINDIQTLPVLGNHDHMFSPSAEFMKKMWNHVNQSGWPEYGDKSELYYSRVVNGIKHIIIDTMRTPDDNSMSEWQKEFVINEIENSNHNILMHQHIHILPSGNWTDKGVYVQEDLLKAVMDSPKVLGIFSGHSHKTSLWEYRGKLFGTFPTTVFGIGDKTGWGGIVLKDKKIEGVFIKELYGENYNSSGHSLQEGKCYFLEPKPVKDEEFPVKI